MGSSLEWEALIFVQLDTPGYRRQISQYRLRFLTASQRLRLEIARHRLLARESWGEIEARIRFSSYQIGSFPSYILLEGCPPCVEEDLGYYEL